MSDIVNLKNRSQHLTALIVEDSLIIQKQMKMFLEKLFKKVYIANDGLEGLDLFKRVSPDVILTDLQMPKMDGHEFIENVKKIDNKTQIIVFSAYGHAENIIKFLRMGVTDFLQKPVNFTQLTQSLQKAVNNIHNENIVHDDEKFDDPKLEELRVLKNNKSPVTLINHYKGLPLVHEGFITSITKETISIQTQKVQIKAILYKNETIIDTKNYAIKAKLKFHDKNNDELIFENLEETKRGLYSGSVGYFTPDGNFDFNVIIRSILYNQSQKYVSYSVGSAITAKSNPLREYEECLIKAKAMREVLEG